VSRWKIKNSPEIMGSSYIHQVGSISLFAVLSFGYNKISTFKFYKVV